MVVVIYLVVCMFAVACFDYLMFCDWISVLFSLVGNTWLWCLVLLCFIDLFC